ncbi:MAG: hypothetical protein AAFP69_09875, partial [Planctomycetota bacterium]
AVLAVVPDEDQPPTVHPTDTASADRTPAPSARAKTQVQAIDASSEPKISLSELAARIDIGGGRATANVDPEVVREIASTQDLGTSVSKERDQVRSRLHLVVRRCRLKAEGARWAAERRRRIAAGRDFTTDIEPRDKEIISKAKQFDECFLWTNHSSTPEPRDTDDFDLLADCFETLSESAAAVETAMQLANEQGVEDNLLPAMRLMAEAQSALRVAVTKIGYRTDHDQKEAFQWLLAQTATVGTIDRYMKTADTAAPEDSEDLRERINRIDQSIRGESSRWKDRGKLLSKIRWEAKHAVKQPEEFVERSRKILTAITRLIGDGLAPSDVEIRHSLLPLVDRFDEIEGELPDEMLLVLREIHRYLSRNPSEEPPQQEPEPSDDVQEVIRHVRGTAMMMIGGERRRSKQQAIEKAFQLSELFWETTGEHTLLDRFLPTIRRDDVSVVLMAIRWSSHSYGDLEFECRKHGKLFVRLPAGTNPNQIAHQILLQAGDRLGNRSSTNQ